MDGSPPIPAGIPAEPQPVVLGPAVESTPTRWARWRANVVEVLAADGPLLLLCLTFIGLGVFLRTHGLSWPQHITWDEDHFVNGARNYIAGHPDVNDHPPLGKLIIALPMLALGDNSLAWRLAPLILGMGNILLAGLLGRKAFSDARAGLIAAAFVAGDGFFTTYSRTALMDGMMTFFFLASVLSFFRARHLWQLALGGFLAGCAASVKFTGIVLVPPLLATCWLQRRHLRWWSFVATITFPLTYLGIFSLALRLTGRPANVTDIVATSLDLLKRHKLAHTQFHPASSYWYTWWLPLEPITLRYLAVSEHRIRGLVTLGNPFLWWSTLVALVTAVGQAGVWLYRRARHHVVPDSVRDRVGAGMMLFVLWALPIVPWMISTRDSYLYHYLPAYGFGLVLLAGLIAHLYRKRPLLGLAFVVVAFLVCAFYAPLSGQLEVTHGGWRERLFLWD